MTAPNPEKIRTQDMYDDWLDDRVDHEIEEFVDVYEEPFHITQVDTWIDESPALADNDWSWCRIFDQVYDNGYNTYVTMEITIPAENPWHKIATAVRHVLSMDLANRMTQELRNRGYEVEQ